MIISMRKHASKEEIDHVCDRIREFGFKVHSIVGDERVVIGAVGVGDVTPCLEMLEAAPGVESAVRISAPYKFVSREFKAERTRIRVNGAEVGGNEFIVMAGPCSVESEKQIMDVAEVVAAAGAKILRGGAFKPRTSPYEFQGLELEGLKLLAKAREATGLSVVTEVLSEKDVEMVAEYANIMQVGARNMQNFALLKALGKCQRPILLKRGMSSTLTRNTCDITAVSVLNELTHLPVILDPSHATGKRSLVASLARAGVAIGADGVIVEVHPTPEKAFSDGAQSLTFDMFRAMMKDLKPYIALWKESRATATAAA
jgi:3-deoxy-7-phosphoheptulonate synthase